jgi:hypothetical protein
MDRKRSDTVVAEYRGRDRRAGRRVFRYRRVFHASPEAVFPLLCPTREYDWIPGWACELVFTETGYAEEDCVFRTNDGNPFGSGTWVMTRLVPDEALDIVKVSPETVLEMKITLTRNPDGTTTGEWTLILTGLTEAGDRRIAGMPEADPRFEALLAGLGRYLTGEG